jgi:hypothetical protein
MFQQRVRTLATGLALAFIQLAHASEWNPSFFSGRLPRTVRKIIQDPLGPPGCLLALASDSPRFWRGYFSTPQQETWVPLEHPTLGTNGPVTAMAVDGTRVYVSGDFTGYSGTAANMIIQRNEFDGPWTPVISSRNIEGLGAHVRAMASCDGNMYFAGEFTRDGPFWGSGFHTNMNRITMWNSTSRDWVRLGTGLNQAVHAIACG